MVMADIASKVGIVLGRHVQNYIVLYMSAQVQLTSLRPKKINLNPTHQRSVPFTWNPPMRGGGLEGVWPSFVFLPSLIIAIEAAAE